MAEAKDGCVKPPKGQIAPEKKISSWQMKEEDPKLMAKVGNPAAGCRFSGQSTEGLEARDGLLTSIRWGDIK